MNKINKLWNTSALEFIKYFKPESYGIYGFDFWKNGKWFKIKTLIKEDLKEKE